MKSASKRPPIYMVDVEADALADLAVNNQNRHPVATALLLEEIFRAKIHSSAKIPPDVVRMGAIVEFLDEGRGISRSVQLVYPQEADTTAGRISILTPLGAGLIGMRVGSSISWPDRSGSERSVKIVAMRHLEAGEPSDLAATK